MKKLCPLCGSTNWDYDIIISLSGLCFCGGCWHDVKQEALKIGYNSFSIISEKTYNKALKIAKKLRG